MGILTPLSRKELSCRAFLSSHRAPFAPPCFSRPADPVACTWGEPIPGMPGKVQGFRLEADGGASSVNMATLTTERWKREGDRLILEGKSIGNGQTIEYRDEWTVLESGEVLRLRSADGAERVLERAK